MNPEQLAAAAEALGSRVHGLAEADPLARKVLKQRFPEAVAYGWLGARRRGNRLSRSI